MSNPTNILRDRWLKRAALKNPVAKVESVVVEKKLTKVVVSKKQKKTKTKD